MKLALHKVLIYGNDDDHESSTTNVLFHPTDPEKKQRWLKSMKKASLSRTAALRKGESASKIQELCLTPAFGRDFVDKNMKDIQESKYRYDNIKSKKLGTFN